MFYEIKEKNQQGENVQSGSTGCLWIASCMKTNRQQREEGKRRSRVMVQRFFRIRIIRHFVPSVPLLPVPLPMPVAPVTRIP